MTQFLRDEASDSEEVVTSLMLDGTYLSRNFATLGPVNLTAAVCHLLFSGCSKREKEDNINECSYKLSAFPFSFLAVTSQH